MPLFGESYKKPPKKKAVRIPGIVKLDGKPQKVNPSGESWLEILFFSGKRRK